MASLGERWTSHVFATIQAHRGSAEDLKRVSVDADLARWTALLTTTVVVSYERLGWQAAGKGRRCNALLVGRNQHLSEDGMAFPQSAARWRCPVAVSGLESATRPDRVADSLWKILCVPCDLRNAYRYWPYATTASASAFASSRGEVVSGVPLTERVDPEGETPVVVGPRNDSETFPHRFFQISQLNSNTGRSERVARR